MTTAQMRIQENPMKTPTCRRIELTSDLTDRPLTRVAILALIAEVHRSWAAYCRWHDRYSGRPYYQAGDRLREMIEDKRNQSLAEYEAAWEAIGEAIRDARGGEQDHGRVRTWYTREGDAFVSLDGLVILSWRDDYVHIHDLAVERAGREAARKRNREAHLAYLKLLDEAAASVAVGAMPEGWTAHSGQEGGCLIRERYTPPSFPSDVGRWWSESLSIPGVLRRAGVSVADDEMPIDALRRATASEVELTPLPRMRVRRLPPSQRAVLTA